MTGSEYMDRLHAALAGMDEEVVRELTEDVRAHFAEGAANGQSDEEICAELGSPEGLAEEARSIIGKEEYDNGAAADESGVSAEVPVGASCEAGDGASRELTDGAASEGADRTVSEAAAEAFTAEADEQGKGTRFGKEGGAGADREDSEGRIIWRAEGIGRVELNAEYADVVVRSGEAGVVRVICETTDQKARAQFYCEREGDVLRTGLRKRTEYSILERLFNRSEVRITLIVPDDLSEGAVLASASGDIDAELLRMPRLEFHTASGDISVRYTDSRTLLVHTASGDARLEGSHAGRIDAGSASGDLTFAEIKAEVLKASAASGDIELLNVRLNSLICKAASGDIDITGSIASVRSETASGDIQLACTGSCAVDLKLVSGDAVVISGTEISGHVQSVSGDVRLETASLVSGLSVQYGTVSGDMRISRGCERNTGKRGGSIFIPGRESGTKENAARLTVQTASGDLVVH